MPTQIYIKSLLPLLQAGHVKAFAHITGGGLPGNLSRVLGDWLAAEIHADQWNIQPVFGWLANKVSYVIGYIPMHEIITLSS